VNRLCPRLGLLATLILAVSALTCACGGSPHALTRGLAHGLTQQQAVTMATTQARGVSSAPVTFISAASGRLGAFDTNAVDPGHQVWAVTFDGTFKPPSCGPAGPPHPCPSQNTSLRMFLDYVSGAFVIAEEPAPGL